MVDFRRDMYAHPELFWKKTSTTERICGFLESRGIAYVAFFNERCLIDKIMHCKE